MENVTLPQQIAVPNPQPERNKPKIFPIIVTVVVLLGLGFVMLSTVRQRPVPTQPAQVNTVPPSATPTVIPRPVLGTMTMKTKDSLLRYPAGKPVTIIIQANSAGKRIVAYDAILGYDSQGFSYDSSKSLPADFQVYPFDRKSYISFSGIRSIQSKTLDEWTSYPLIEVIMMPKKTGKYVFELSPQGGETSKLVDDKNQIVYPKTMELHLEIY